MKITLIPAVAADGVGAMSMSVSGDTLTINGTAFDLSGVSEGDTLPAEAVAHDHVVHEVTRVSGEINLSVVLPCSHEAMASLSQSVVTTASGAVSLPSTGL